MVKCTKTPEELVSSRFWEMRKLLLGFEQPSANISIGDLVTVECTTMKPLIVVAKENLNRITLMSGTGELFFYPAWFLGLNCDVIASVAESSND